MYIKTVRVRYLPGKEEEAIRMRKELIHPALAQQPGFVRAELWKCTDGTGEYLIINCWDSQEAAEAWTKSPVHDAVRAQAIKLMTKPITPEGYVDYESVEI